MSKVLHPEVFHNKCVCQICTCHKHKCPHSQLNQALDGNTTYGDDFRKHPIHIWAKPAQSGPPEDRHYDYINSAYRQHYPGHPAGMREKYKPRVKEEDSDLPFHGDSEYKTKYGPKFVEVQKPRGQKQTFRSTNEPFDGTSTYKGDYGKKKLPGKSHKQTQQVDFPPGYRFNGNTTYGNSYVEHPPAKTSSYKPQEKIGIKGPHDLNTIYRQDYKEKPFDEPCPILNLPKYKNKIHSPNSHYGYDSVHNKWYEKP